MPGDDIRCRAQVTDTCQDGKPYLGEDSWTMDGTFDGETIVCNTCFLVIMPLTESGRALTREIPAAIVEAKVRALRGDE